MIELFESNIKDQGRLSSKGNQLKWFCEGKWYKADYTGYEGLAEYMISQLLRFSTLPSDAFAVYELEEIRYKNRIYNGAKSTDFLYDNWQIITLERLYMNQTGMSLTQAIWNITDPRVRLTFLVDEVERITGLDGFGKYLNQLFTIDALFLNEDRHMHNIAVLMNPKGEFKYCPIFDNGAGLLSDTTMDYPLGEDIYGLIDEVDAKTISNDFTEQLDLSEELYDENLHFFFTKKDVHALLNNADQYPKEILQRVETIIYEQMRKYKYLFNYRSEKEGRLKT